MKCSFPISRICLNGRCFIGFYWSRLFTTQLQKGLGYHTLRPTITINICHFTLFEEIVHYHSTYHLYEDALLQRLRSKDDVLEIHFIEMDKFLHAWFNQTLNALDDILVRWLLLLGMVDARKQKTYDDIYLELEALTMKDENLQQALSAWEELSQTPETIIAYQSRLKYMIDEVAKLEDAKYHAQQEGIEKGIEKGIKAVAKNMIASGYDNEQIMQLTSLTVEEVLQLRTEIEVE